MDDLFFISSKVIFFFLRPSNFLLSIILISASLYIYKNKKIYKLIFLFFVFTFLIVTIFPIGKHLLYILENRFSKPIILTKNIKGIIVMGGSESDSMTRKYTIVNLNDSSERLIESVLLANQFPQSKILHVGTNDEFHTAKKFYENFKIDIQRIVSVGETRNTFEGIKKLHQTVNSEDFNKYILITSAFHMPRCIGIARKFNLNFIPYPVDHRAETDVGFLSKLQYFNFADRLFYFDMAIKEYLGLIAYRFLKKTSSLLPK